MSRKLLDKHLLAYKWKKEQFFTNNIGYSQQKDFSLKTRKPPYNLYLVSDEEYGERFRKAAVLYEHFKYDSSDEPEDHHMFNDFEHFVPWFFLQNLNWEIWDLTGIDKIATRYGYCFFCVNFIGHKKGHAKVFHNEIKGKQKVLSIFGNCNPREIKKSINYKHSYKTTFSNQTFYHVLANHRCNKWFPNSLTHKVISNRVFKYLMKNCEGDYELVKYFMQESKNKLNLHELKFNEPSKEW